MTAILERRKARMQMRRAARQRVSDGLEAWLDLDEPTTMATLFEAFGEKILAAGCLILMLPSAMPIPTAGATHVLDVVALLLALQLVLGRRQPWIPDRWRRKELGRKTQKGMRFAIRFVRWCEKLSHPRMAVLVRSRPAEIVLGLVMTGFIVGAFLSPPFSGLDTLPALGVVVLALGILLEDVAFAIAGVVVGLGGIGIAIFLGSKITHVLAGII